MNSDILKNIAEYKFEHVLLAVSGGLDSICLAHYFITNQKNFGIKQLAIAHIHHGLRKSADRDAEFVKNFADKFHVPFFIRYLDGKALTENGSVEENARLARYQELHEIAELSSVRADAIFTAHHANDQAETVLMRILRGSSWKGLRGISRIRDDYVIRPFLQISKSELEIYAKKNHLDFVTDETNADISFARNFLRNALIPALKPDMLQLSRVSHLASNLYAKILREADATISPFILSKKLWPFSARFSPFEKTLAIHSCAWEKLSHKSPAGAAEIFRIWLTARGFDFPASLSFSSNLISRDGNFLFEKSRGIFWFCQNPKKEIAPFPFGSRPKKDGDIIILKNRPPRKLVKYMAELGIPEFVRDAIPCILSGESIVKLGE